MEFQSTHPRGVRHRASPPAPADPGFNPRTREGCDSSDMLRDMFKEEFQSTHPRGVRPKFIFIFTYCRNVSIHAPARGATLPFEEKVKVFNVSIHAPARGATLIINDKANGIDVSIHAPARGATLLTACAKSLSVVSIHAPAM